MPKIDAGAVGSDNILGTRVLVGSILHELMQPADVVRSDGLRVRQGTGDAPGNTAFVQRDVGVAGDDGTGGAIDSLAHQVAAKTTLLALEARANGLHGPAALLQRPRDRRYVVVHVRGDVILQQLLA